MADSNPKLQTALNSETADLSVLAARKDLHRELTASAANSPDLASASISPSEVLRVSQRTDVRRSIQENASTPQASLELTNSRSRSAAGKSADGTATGIFKNPFYRYDGGLLNKILALIGNILKALERIFLRLLGARDAARTPHRHNSSQTKPESATTDAHEQQLEKEKRKERREQAELLVKRQ